jgi:site-specific DNA-methyltransferase (adenine-specific)
MTILVPPPAARSRAASRLQPLMQSGDGGGSVEWYTPAWLVARVVQTFGGPIALDPCSTPQANRVVAARRFYTRAQDGLARPWRARPLFLNPPYGREIGRWIEKLLEAFTTRQVGLAIALVPARTETAWFRLLRERPRCFIRGRVPFWGPADRGSGSPFPSAVIALGCELEAFAAAFGDVGDIYVAYGT